MDQTALQEVLRELSFSSPLPESTLAELARLSTTENFVAGSLIFSEGSENHYLYLVRQGRVALEMNVLGRGNVRILTLGPGDIVAWSALFGGGQMTTSARALEPTELIAADAQALLDLCGKSPAIGYPFMKQVALALSSRLVATRMQLLDLFAPANSST